MPSFFINSLSIGSLLLHSNNYLFSVTVDYVLLFHQFPLDRLTPPPLLQLPSCTNSLIMATPPRQSTPRYRRHTGIPLPQLPACHQRPQPPHRCHLRHRCDSGEGLRKRPPGADQQPLARGDHSALRPRGTHCPTNAAARSA